MAWVRYDDQFYGNPKVTAVIAEDVGALALHLLANSWTNGQKHQGFVPAHQPAVLLLDRGLGQKWAATLVHARLWEETSNLCPECREEYAALPAHEIGYVFHNAKEYRAPARERQTPGTPADLSAKRREAGRKGGQAAAARRQQDQQNELAKVAIAVANQANEYQNPADPGLVTPIDQQVSTGAQDADLDASRVGQIDQGIVAEVANGVSKARASAVLLVSPVPVPEPVPDIASGEATLFAVQEVAKAKAKAETKADERAKRATRIPADFKVTPEMVKWATDRCPGVNGKNETEKFIYYWTGKGGKDATKVDWPATWRSWMLNALERTGTRPSTNYSGAYSDAGNERDYSKGSL
jgi:hypothetical protein